MAAISRRRGQPKLPGSLKKIHLRESVFKQWREKKQHLGFEEHTDSVFAEFLLHRRKATTNRGSADRNLSLSVEDNGTASVVNSEYCTVQGNPCSVFNADHGQSAVQPDSDSDSGSLEGESQLLEDSEDDLEFTSGIPVFLNRTIV
ncbi:hypothetical protein OS493_009083 [Desmophyllum pertusum]|uniref:Uncharacterized protein n=1 Tax=Desmophyllum pertusum TaxID=174260 RepID=A0A9W9ZFL8_9CNID|nr:hypothetical protein OS493_009083 [Desmophyllum pertusum]